MVRRTGNRPKLSVGQRAVLEVLAARGTMDLVEVVNELRRRFPDPPASGPSLRWAQRTVAALRHNGYVGCEGGPVDRPEAAHPLRWDALDGFIRRGELVAWDPEPGRWRWADGLRGPGGGRLIMTRGGAQALADAPTV
jgi:hypothetical protein